MAYVAPTAAEMKARFPVLSALENATIEAFVSEASRQVDESWVEADYKTAIQYLAAHMMVAEGLVNSDGVAAVVGTTGPVKSESLGDASLTYSDRGGSGLSGDEAELSTTPYGQRFAELRRKNHFPVLIVP